MTPLTAPFLYPVTLPESSLGLTITGQSTQPLAELGQTRPLIVALHGWLDNSASFAPMVPFLSGYDLLALDLPGHGWSEAIGRGASYHFLDWVILVHELLEQTLNRPYILLGHSLGACIATLVAGMRPNHLQKLALIDGLIPLSQSESEIHQQVRTHIQALRKSRSIEGPRVFSDQKTPSQLRKSKGSLSLASATLIAHRNLKEVEGGFAWRYDPRLRLPSTHRLSSAQISSFCQQIVVPTMLIVAEFSEFPVLKYASDQIAVMPTLQILKRPGGHHLHMDTPEIVFEALEPFLSYKKA